ncbi:MAG: hypothetical protein HXY45_13815 [Syntrophaceae bacterium]|nr:hypothetical protein [Syntrophaceae bacterium]
MGRKNKTLISALAVIGCLGLWAIGVKSPAQAGPAPDLSSPMAQDRIRACGFIVPQKIPALGSIVGSQDPSANLSEGDLVYLKLEPGTRLKPGDKLAITRIVKEVEHPLTGAKIGFQVSFPGRAVILDGKGPIVPAKIEKSFFDIRHGDLITPISYSPPSEVALRSPEGIKGVVVAAAEEQENISEREVVYIDRGARDGVIMGDLFTIYQLPYFTDETRQKEAKLPQMKVGEAVVIHLGKETSTLLVTHSSQSIYVGDTVVLGKGK